MTNLLVINSSRTVSSDLLGLLDELDYGFLTEEYPAAIDEQVGSGSIDLVVYICTSKDKARGTVSLYLPAAIPLLAIDPSPGPNSSPVEFPQSSTIDHLQLPFGRDILEQRIRLLLHIRRLTLELESTREHNKTLKEELSQLRSSLNGQSSILDQLSRRDGLTGLFNRHHFNAILQEMFTNMRARGADMALVILNIDYFSEINRSCGQEFGDFVLNEFAARLTRLSRENDLCFRLSGEDFAILMPATNERSALQAAERVRNACAENSFNTAHTSRTITVSAGIATLQRHTPRSHDELISMADQALFAAKSDGRNRSRSYVPVARGSSGSSEESFKILQDTITRILDKTKLSTVHSLQLLAQGIMEPEETSAIKQAQNYTELLCHKLGFPPPMIETFKNAIVLLSSMRFLLHHEFIGKEGALTVQEWNVLADFPYKVYQLAKIFDYFSGERSILLHHGERYDGTGYPEGLQGDDIPVGARVFHLVCAVAAMNTDRPYRKKLTTAEILAELTENAGKQFDPKLVLKLIDVIEEKGILSLSHEELENSRKKIKRYLEG